VSEQEKAQAENPEVEGQEPEETEETEVDLHVKNPKPVPPAGV
jgi:hypothetical protein